MQTSSMPAYGQMVPTYITSIVDILSIELVIVIVYFADTLFAYAMTTGNDDHGTLGGRLAVQSLPHDSAAPSPN